MKDGLSHKDQIQNYLLVEGSGDIHVFGSLLNYHQIINNDYKNNRRFKGKDEAFDIQDKDGIDRLLQDLEIALKKNEPYRRYGIVIDADDDCLQQWDRVRNLLIRSRYDQARIPRQPQSDGFIIKPDERPAFGVWVMPNNNNPGNIEDFIGLLRKPDDVLWPVAEDIVQKVMQIDCRFSIEHESKARLHTWLAWQKHPGKSMGQSITNKYVLPDCPLALQLVHWIRQLFELQNP
jgi:hypothetical protein